MNSQEYENLAKSAVRNLCKVSSGKERLNALLALQEFINATVEESRKVDGQKSWSSEFRERFYQDVK